METFGQRLRQMRQLAVLTQTELADKAGLSIITVHRLEKDADKAIAPRPATVRALAKALEVDPTWLLYGDEGESVKRVA
jgi:transcriptional regulator with XRE-family HTH domain